MAARIVQDLKVCRPYRPPAPLWLKLAYFGAIFSIVGSVGRVAYEYQRGVKEVEKAAENRRQLASATADVNQFTTLFNSYDQARRIGSSRKEWLNSSPNAAAIQLALIRTIQEAGLALKAKKETLSSTPVQMKSMKVVWTPRQDKIPGTAKVDLALSSSAPKPAVLRELNRCLSRATESLGLAVTSPHWGDAPGGVLTLNVELKETRP